MLEKVSFKKINLNLPLPGPQLTSDATPVRITLINLSLHLWLAIHAAVAAVVQVLLIVIFGIPTILGVVHNTLRRCLAQLAR